jgi:protein-S-isoprenylcysteine O-methyltransferase Ste14
VSIIKKGSKIALMKNYPQFDRPSLQRHRRQNFLQIILPMVLVVVLLTIAGGFTVAAGQAENRLWADISTIWLVAPLLMVALFLLAILVALIYGLSLLYRNTPEWMRRVQHLFSRIQKETHNLADSTVKPVLWIHQVQNGIKTMFGKIKPAK